MTEQQIQRKIMNYLKRNHNAFVVNVITASVSGIPDILACVNGKFIAIEVKKPTTIHTVTKLQEAKLQQVTEAGGIALVATSIEDVERILNE